MRPKDKLTSIHHKTFSKMHKRSIMAGLRSREPSVKATERKLKPRKVVATNKSLKKVNISMRSKSLQQQTSMRRLRPRKNRKNYCEDSKLLRQYISLKQQDSVVVVEKLHLEGNKKVPVYKAVGPSEKSSEDKSDVYDFKFDSDDTREKATKKKQKKRNFNKGKGKTTKKMIRKKVTTQSKTSDLEVIKPPPKPDTNLSMEEVAQNVPSKRAVVKKSIKRVTVKKVETLKKDMDIPIVEESINKDIEKEIEPPRIVADIETIEISTEDTGGIVETPRIDVNIQEQTILPTTSAQRITEENTSKPRIISVENANNIIVTRSPPNKTGDLLPFRPKNIFDNKTSKGHNSTSSLLMKTLSPILKTTNTCDFGSPWRPPILTFSQTRHFIQSTPYNNFEAKKENKEIKKKSIELNKENMEMDKENMAINKENKGRGSKERKKKIIGFRKKHAIQKKLPILENQAPEKVRTAVSSKSVVQPAPARVSLGEIKNLLLRPNNVGDNKQTVDQVQTETDKPLVEQKNKKLVDFLNFSDTFDVLSETERLSNVENDGPLFVDLEPSHFSKPPEHSYKRKRNVKFNFSEDSDEEEKENVKLLPKKKKVTKIEREQEKRVNEWIKSINSTFQEIEEHDLLIEQCRK